MIDAYYVNPAKKAITSIPPELSRKVARINCHAFIFENPSMASPTSSGIGEAMRIAPTSGIDQEKYGVAKVLLKTFGQVIFEKMGFSSSNTLSLKNLNIKKSPITVPMPAITETAIGLSVPAKSNNITAAGANVKVDTKNIPAKKELIYPKLPILLIIPTTKSVPENKINTIILKIRNAVFLYFQLLSLEVIDIYYISIVILYIKIE
jgi:hypothetical protein